MIPESAADAGFLLINERKIFAHVTGASSPAPSVILIGGGGGTTATWTEIQNVLSIPALSYDRAGLGASDSTPEPQSLDEMITDLLILIAEARLAPPFLLVGHSVGGVHARKLATVIPHDIAGIVLVDSSHEEQVWRLGDTCPAILDSEYGPGWRDEAAMQRLGWLAHGERSTWHLDVPLIVLEHRRSGRPNPFPTLPEEDFLGFEETWHALQVDLASRSKYGELREAKLSGHGIPASQPNLILEAIAEIVSRMGRS